MQDRLADLRANQQHYPPQQHPAQQQYPPQQQQQYPPQSFNNGQQYDQQNQYYAQQYQEQEYVPYGTFNGQGAHNETMVQIVDEQQEDQEMKEFFAEVANVKNLMSLVRRNIQTMQNEANQDTYNGHGGLDHLLDETNTVSGQIRKRLDGLKREATRQDDEQANQRVKMGTYKSLAQKFIDMMGLYQQVQTSYQQRCEQRFHRQAQIINPDITEEEATNMMHSAMADPNFVMVFAEQEQKERAKNALLYIQEQRRDLVLLESSINEVHQMFLDMATLVDFQRETFDAVQDANKESRHFIQKANFEMKRTLTHVNSRRKKTCMCFSCYGIIILIVAAILGTFFAIIGAKLAAEFGAF
eukprot:TRINITY_DN2708_c0_g1_i1.p1 TRINITY_DN2708_c0_g1~~TRINITY_DN2708_c0_g1_i1.p1  ORF type:complete len:366 (-),score=133.17 TRINITY_DN2708_c0_g1_i1:81-1148(-)